MENMPIANLPIGLATGEKEPQNPSALEIRPDAEVVETIRKVAGWSGIARLVFFLVLIGIFVGVYAGANQYYQPRAPQYRTEQCRQGDLVVTVAATGTLEPTNLVEIGCEISGTIHTVEVAVNDTVKAGDLLFTLDTQELEALVAKSLASLEARQAELRLAMATLLESQQKLQGMEKLFAARAVSREEFNVAQANVARAKANVSSSKAQISGCPGDVGWRPVQAGKVTCLLTH